MHLRIVTVSAQAGPSMCDPARSSTDGLAALPVSEADTLT